MAQDPTQDLLDRRTREGNFNSRMANLERRVLALEKSAPVHFPIVAGAPTGTPPYGGSPAVDKNNSNRLYLWTPTNGWKSVGLA